jgi:hypothetical protein
MEAKPVSLIYTYRKAFSFPPSKYPLALYATIPTYNSPAVPVRIKVHGETRGSKLALPVFPALYVTLEDVKEEYIPNEILKVDKSDFSFRTPNPGGASRFHVERDPGGPNILAVGTLEADIVRSLEKVDLKWKEANGRYEAELDLIKGPGDYAIECGIAATLAGRKVPLPSHLTAKWNGKMLFDRTEAEHKVSVHVVEGSKWYEDYTVHLTLSPADKLKQTHPSLIVLFFPQPQAPIWEIK